MLDDSDSKYSLYNLFKLLKEKYRDVAFKEVAEAVNNEIKIVIANDRNIINNNTDGNNLPLIEFLKSFNANVRKVNTEHFYIGNSIITFHESRLNDVITGLQTMLKPENHSNKMVMK
jgi:hypothetical protein